MWQKSLKLQITEYCRVVVTPQSEEVLAGPTQESRNTEDAAREYNLSRILKRLHHCNKTKVINKETAPLISTDKEEEEEVGEEDKGGREVDKT